MIYLRYLKNHMLSKLLPILLLFSICLYSIDAEIKCSSNSAAAYMHPMEFTPEKIYVHFDKSDYVAEENIWFKVYLYNAATSTLGTNTQVVYIDLIDPNNKIHETKMVRALNGFGAGNITLPFDAIEGEYTIRAYTNYMRNFDDSIFFQESVFVRSRYSSASILPKTTRQKTTTSDLSVQFFPEGGQMVSGYNNKVGFKVTGDNNKGIDIEGEIVDETGKKVIRFSTSKFGMGLLHLVPQDGKQYIANIFHNNTMFTFNLPRTMNSGIALRIIEGKEYYQANIQSSLKEGINQYKFTAKQRNGEIFNSEIVGNSANAIIKIPKHILREGIINFELSDPKNEKVVSRLVFYEGLAAAKPKVTVDTINTGLRQKVLFNLDSGADMTANISVALAKVPENRAITDALGIKTYLLLTSEVSRTIEQPTYYIYSSETERKKNLDVLMLTQKWKEHSMAKKTGNQSALEYDYETGITVSGTVKSGNNKDIPAIAKVSLSYKNSETIGFDETTSDANGRFVFRNLDFSDDTSIMLQALNLSSDKKSKKGSSDFHIEMDTFTPPKIATLKKYSTRPSNVIGTKRLNIISDSLQQVDDNVIQLDEAEVKTKVIKKEKTYYTDRRLLYKQASQTLDFADYNDMDFQNPLEVLRGRIPGLTVRNDTIYLRASSSIAVGNSALILIDGIPVGSDALSLLLSSDIDFIDIIKGPRAAIFGSRAANGVIAVYTKTGNTSSKSSENSTPSSNIKFKHVGFIKTQEFNVEIHNIEKNNHLKNNSSTTLVWKPNLLLTNKSEVLLETKKEPGSYKITVEGLTFDGRPINVMKYWSRNPKK